MTDNQLSRAIKHVAIGYLLLIFNLNLATINIIPNWISYLLFYKAIKPISNYEKSTTLLKSFSIGLGIYEFIIWLTAIFTIKLNNYLIITIVGICTLYFHFQLLTNIANIAKQHQCRQAKAIYRLRTIKTILLMMTVYPIDYSQHLGITITYLSLNLLVTFVLCFNLFDYASDEKS